MVGLQILMNASYFINHNIIYRIYKDLLAGSLSTKERLS